MRDGSHLARLAMLMCLVMTMGVVACAPRRPPRPKLPPSIPPSLHGQKPYQVGGVWYYPLPSAEGYHEKGLASWYGSAWHGKRTASGEIYNMYAMTAAHKVLPFGTHVKVTHLVTGRSVIVRINDRGPFVKGRIIDLSYAAAHRLGLDREGVAPVMLETVRVVTPRREDSKMAWRPEPRRDYTRGFFTIQVGSFREKSNAERLKSQLSAMHANVRIRTFWWKDRKFFRVQVGTYVNLPTARHQLAQVRAEGFPDAFIVALEE